MAELRTPRRAVSALFFLNGGLYGIWASRIPAIADKHALGPGTLGLLLLLLAAGAIVAFPLAGRASDALGAGRVSLGLGAVYTLTLFALGLAPSIWLLAVALLLCGALFGGLDVSMNSWAGEVERHVGRPIMSSFHAMFSLGAGIGAGSGYLAVQAGLGPAAHFLLVGGAMAVGCLWTGNIGWTSPRRAATTGSPVFALPRGALLAVGLMTFCSAMGEGAMADWSAIFLVVSTGVGEARAALGFAAFSVAMVAVRLMGDRIILHFGAVRAAQLAGLAACFGTALAVVFSGSFWMVLLGFAILGIGYALIFPLAFSRAANDPDIAPGAAIASVATLGYGGILLGPPVIGFVAELASLRVAFGLLALMPLLIVALARTLRTAPVEVSATG
ncbi:MFS transporter [Fluviibacterium sp. DFM31]|uniref:MFS transporter n=1 Tax=Meridianimarinicoccus marinus TaxID=3231483 RepID=A0ABV3L6W9_9RHOB